MSDLEKFAERELELKASMTFGEWLRHIVKSHEELVSLIRCGVADRVVQVDVLDRQSGALEISTYELPAICHRVVIDVQGIQGSVWGFCRTIDSIHDTQKQANLISRRNAALSG